MSEQPSLGVVFDAMTAPEAIYTADVRRFAGLIVEELERDRERGLAPERTVDEMLDSYLSASVWTTSAQAAKVALYASPNANAGPDYYSGDAFAGTGGIDYCKLARVALEHDILTAVDALQGVR